MGSQAMLSIILLSLGLASAEHNGVLPEQPNILFLMCDSMDGRVLDPTSPVSSRLEMPHLQALASTGVNFSSTYAASRNVCRLRATMFTDSAPIKRERGATNKVLLLFREQER